MAEFAYTPATPRMGEERRYIVKSGDLTLGEVYSRRVESWRMSASGRYRTSLRGRPLRWFPAGGPARVSFDRREDAAIWLRDHADVT